VTIYAETFSASYPVRPKNTGALEQVRGDTLVTELSVEDLVRLDPASIASYASPANRRAAERLVSGAGGYWGHVTDNQHLSQLVLEGWQEGTDEVAELAERVLDLIPRPATRKRRVAWGEEGSYLCPERLLEGDLDRCWRTFRQERKQGHRVLTVDVDVGQNCHLSADSLKWSGIAAVALTDALERAGYRVELYATSACRSNTPGGGVAVTRMLAKGASQPLNVALLAALVALPATFRWYHVMSWLAHPVSIGAGYGQSVALQEVLDQCAVQGKLRQAEVLMEGSASRDEAEQTVLATVERLGLLEAAAMGTMV
jgi:hypothetical protein